ncbi:Multimodular transpeptidase-transglycosylase PBP 2A [Streptococcus pyogenes MGAS2096]|nr:Multimodular transpeptidase-transglycosylase PBP 2A [Streptococcus pyogenes MGAS2096]
MESMKLGNQSGVDTQSIIDGLRKSAQEASQSLSKAVDQSGLRDKAQSIWKEIVDYFR